MVKSLQHFEPELSSN